MNKLFILLLFILSVQCYSPTGNNTVIQEGHHVSDSMIILYDQFSHLVLSEGVRSYRDFVECRNGEPLLSTTIYNPRTISFIDSCINNAKPASERYGIDTDFLLIRFSEEKADTIGIGCLPGRFQICDTLYQDTLVYQAIMEQLARVDTVWLNESIDGAVYYQSVFLGRKAAEKRFWQKHPLDGTK